MPSVEAATREGAIAAAREKYGSSARVVAVRKTRSGGVMGFFATERYVAEVEEVEQRRREPAPLADSRRRIEAALSRDDRFADDRDDDAYPAARQEPARRAGATRSSRPDPVDELAGLLGHGAGDAPDVGVYDRASFARAASAGRSAAPRGGAAANARPATAPRARTGAGTRPPATPRADGEPAGPSLFTAALAQVVSDDSEVRAAVEEAVSTAVPQAAASRTAAPRTEAAGRSATARRGPATPTAGAGLAAALAAVERAAAEKAAAERAAAERAEAARLAAEQEAARITAQREAARLARERAAAEAARLAAEEEAARLAAEQEAARIAAEEEAARVAAEEEAARLAAEAARVAAEEEAARLAAEAARIAAEQEAARIAAEEEAARFAAEQEAARIAAEQEAMRIAAEQEAARIAAEQEAARIAAEQEALRIAAEQEAARIAAEEEAARIAAEQEAARIATEQEAARMAAERQAARLVAEREAARILAEQAAAAEAVRIAAEREAVRMAEPITVEFALPMEDAGAPEWLSEPEVAGPASVREEAMAEVLRAALAHDTSDDVLTDILRGVLSNASQRPAIRSAAAAEPGWVEGAAESDEWEVVTDVLAPTASDPAPLPLDATTILPPLSLLPPPSPGAQLAIPPLLGGRPPVPPPRRLPPVPGQAVARVASSRAPQGLATVTPLPVPRAGARTGGSAVVVTSVRERPGGLVPMGGMVDPRMIEAVGVVNRLRALGLPEALLGGGFAADIAAHGTYAALTRVLAKLPAAPAVPTGPGEVLLVVGPGAETLAAARSLAASLRLDADRLQWASRGDLANLVAHGSRIASVDTAMERKQEALQAGEMTVVAVDAPLRAGGRTWLEQMLAIWAPSAVWAVVEATRKSEDLGPWLDALPRVDALMVQDTDLTADPAAVLSRAALPVALLDGARATAHRWASLLCERLESDET
ncbi:hypothetical protein [Trujillonella humicola]|uniref:hypothetical protein n=1 Tax=Trujillonella humicola TaxID=3383699 RepID=UPI0039062380